MSGLDHAPSRRSSTRHAPFLWVPTFGARGHRSVSAKEDEGGEFAEAQLLDEGAVRVGEGEELCREWSEELLGFSCTRGDDEVDGGWRHRRTDA